jgi:hypothetical protein
MIVASVIFIDIGSELSDVMILLCRRYIWIGM